MRAIAALALASFASQAWCGRPIRCCRRSPRTSPSRSARLHRHHRLCADPRLDAVHHRTDRRPFGKYRTVAIACALSAGTVALCGLARSLDSLTLARFASGITVAWILPISLAYIGDVVPYEQRQQLLGRFLAARCWARCSARPPAASSATTSAGAPCSSCWRRCSASPPRPRYELATNPITRVDRSAPKGLGAMASYKIVLRNPWARIMLLVVGSKAPCSRASFRSSAPTCICAFGLSFTAIGIIIGVFATAG
jgi:MFS family permease